MKDPAISVKGILVNAGVGVFNSGAAFGIYIGQPPDKPDALILVNSTGGLSPEPRLALNYPSVQVIVRGVPSGYTAAADKIQTVVNALLGMETTVVEGDTYRSCNLLGDVAYLGQDENTRPMFSANFRFIVEPALMAGGHRVSIT